MVLQVVGNDELVRREKELVDKQLAERQAQPAAAQDARQGAEHRLCIRRRGEPRPLSPPPPHATSPHTPSS